MIISPGVTIGPNITISDPAPTPTFTLTPAADNVDEGSSLTFTVGGTNIDDGTYVWTIESGSGDFLVDSGSFVITSNSGSFEVSPTADNTEEGVETFTVSIRSGSTIGPILQTSGSITINDTSPPLSYTLTPASSNVNEGASLTFTVGGTNITNGTYYWTIENRIGDFGAASGSFSITSNSGSFSVTPTADTTTEGSETFTVAIRSGSTTGPVLKISSSITINDTSLSPVTPDYVTTNLVLYYDPSDAASYSGSGTTINDLSGNGLNGSMSNITYTDPYFSYNGTSSRITVPDNPLLEMGTGNWTMEAWIYGIVFGGTAREIISKAFGGISYRMFASGITLQGWIGDGVTTVRSSLGSVNTLSLNTWTHVAHVFTNGSKLESFINGALTDTVSCGTIAIPNNTGPLTIGSTGNNRFWFNGRIGIVRLYNAALSSTNISTNYNGSKATYGL